MRELKRREITQRGCEYCLHFRLIPTGTQFSQWKKECPFSSCPFHELDNVKTYLQFMKQKRNGENEIEEWIAKLFNL